MVEGSVVLLSWLLLVRQCLMERWLHFEPYITFTFSHLADLAD